MIHLASGYHQTDMGPWIPMTTTGETSLHLAASLNTQDAGVLDVSSSHLPAFGAGHGRNVHSLGLPG